MFAARGDVGAIPLTVAHAPLRYSAPWIALQVRSLVDGGVDGADIAVLFRKEAKNSPQESAVLQHLQKLSVPATTDPQSSEGVRVLSIHQAKGSEYGHVFCLQLGPDHFPDRRGDPEEERRLLYVAITRARDAFSVAGEPGADPDLLDEFESGDPTPIQFSIESLSDVLVLDTLDRTTLGLTDMSDLDVTMLDWDEPVEGP
jgi:superfamily I DNA and RNA helicase